MVKCTVMYRKFDLFLLSFPKVKARLEWMLLKFDHNISVGVFYIVWLKYQHMWNMLKFCTVLWCMYYVMFLKLRFLLKLRRLGSPLSDLHFVYNIAH